jgi:predicted dehydrogenase
MSHNVNLALFLLDDAPVEWVMAGVERTTERFERSFPCEDGAVGIAEVAGGVQIYIASNLGTAGSVGQGCRVIGTEGILDLDTTRPPDHELRSDGAMRSPEGSSAKYNDERGTARLLRAGAGWESLEAPWHDPFVHLAQEAVDWAEGRIDDAISSGRKGRATLEVLMAMYESARKRRRIDLPLKTLANPLQLMVAAGDLPVEHPGPYEQRARLVRGERMSWYE